MFRRTLMVVALVALATAGAAAAHALRHVRWVRPGHCTVVRGQRVCGKVVGPTTITAPPVTVTTTVTVTPPTPSPTAIAVAQVQHEVQWASGGAPPYSHDELTALAALEYVVGHVSVAEYGYLEVAKLPLPAHTPDAILGAQAGICGETSLAFASIMQHLGYTTRRVAFYWTDPVWGPDAHTAVEVAYGGSWHYFDPTFDQYWTDSAGNVMSISGVRASGGTRYKNNLGFTNLIENLWFNGDDTAFQTDPATTVVLGGDPFVG